ncbi:MAG: UDP-N-acetylglucosamine 2-epimerase (hydrolyzing) [Candidatus Omnitrophica bacterium]|nr:UDP-N-acetylglucosamine 2-epimerase (hydrolyzing) [Candidatus Omnitrophota bacterium]
MRKRTICVFTATRAEYGLLFPLLKELSKDSAFDLQLLVSGTHLSKKFGMTYQQIVQDGFSIDAKVDLHLGDDSPVGICRSMARGVEGYAQALKKLNPDMLVILGDRFEALAAATAAMVSRIPIAHISGGESTFGLIDEPIRHSITKMASVHFAATDVYRRRIIQLGENPQRVFNVGALGLDNLKLLKLLSKDELERNLKLKFAPHNLLVTFHPVTLENNTAPEQCQNLLQALNGLKETMVFFTKANADTDGQVINQLIEKYVEGHPGHTRVFTSLGQLNYLSMMQYVDGVVGNSSSGIVEAPSFKIGTVNIGDRQAGRLRSSSIIDCGPQTVSIQKALQRLYSPSFQSQLKLVKNIYGKGGTAVKIVKILKKISLEGILKKEFYDLNKELVNV